MSPSFSALVSLAQVVVAQAPAEAPNPLASMLFPIGLTFFAVYFLLVRPTNKQRAEQQNFLAALKKDDEIVTSSGLIGRITQLEETIVTIEIAEKVRVRLMRDRIVGPFSQPGTPLNKGRGAKA